MNDNIKNKIWKIVRFVLIAGIVVAAIFIFVNYLVGWFLPFILAIAIAFMIQPAVNFLNRKLKLPRKLATIIFLLFLLAVPGLLIFFAVDRIIYELTFLSENFVITDATNKVTDMINNFFAWFDSTFENIPFFYDNNITEQLKNYLTTETGNLITQLISVDKISTFITSIAVIIPKILVITLITIISTFYTSLDYNNITRAIANQIPEKVRTTIIDIKSRFLEAIYKYLRAYFLIFLIAYSELVIGFLIVGIRYAFLIALLVAVVDILPVLGTGTVLIPWGIISIIQKDYFTGFALLILYAVITVVRNIIEPKIVGSSIGLYPLITLICIYVGYNILGVAGIFLLPVCVLILKNLNDEGKINIWKTTKKNEEEINQDKKDKKDKKNNKKQ